MKRIGGFFTFENLDTHENLFFDQLCPPNGDLKFLMSGRCGIYYALEDLKLTDKKRVAYLPLYTCETVIAPFEKAGYQLLFYPFNKDMTPVFDESVLEKISVISICGYYGFVNYDRDFIKRCHEKGITIVEDTTHSVFSSDGIDPHCDYITGSLRKWIGVPSGGFAVKVNGKFSISQIPPNHSHLNMRMEAMHEKANCPDYDSCGQKKAMDVFWDAEMLLRNIFDLQSSDNESIHIMTHYNYSQLKQKRRENYQYLLNHMPSHPDLTMVFPHLTEAAVPSHFTFYAKNRDRIQTYLSEHGISSTAYWPKNEYIDQLKHPQTTYIYEHVLSIPCDQRYDTTDMQYICHTISHMSHVSN